MKIVVVCGGNSREKDVSLKSGEAVFNALKMSFNNVECIVCYKKQDCIRSIINSKADKVFIALHGGWGENGELQAALDMYDISYTGSGFEASCSAMNKFVSKSIMKNSGLPTAKAVLVKSEGDIGKIDFYPVCLKPNREGSSIGVEFAYNKNETLQKISHLLNGFKEIIAEEKIDGKELTVSILNKTILPIIEIRPKKGFYDYKNKYTKGSTEYVVPARLDKNVEQLCKKTAYEAYRSLGCSSIARVDILLKNNVPYVLEINTVPGMTETSLVPKAAKSYGINFKELVKFIVEGNDRL